MAIEEQEAFGSMGVFMGIVAREGTGNVKWQQGKKNVREILAFRGSERHCSISGQMLLSSLPPPCWKTGGGVSGRGQCVIYWPCLNLPSPSTPISTVVLLTAHCR